MDLKSVLEWLISAFASNVVGTYIFRAMARLFPDIGRFLVPDRAWVTGTKVLYAGEYEDVRNPGNLVTLRRGSQFPAGANGANTSWRMTIWDAGEAEEAAKGCQESVFVFMFLLLIGVFFVLFFSWISSQMPNGLP